jgi:ACS family hexuronate transporter-like MFS transporter
MNQPTITERIGSFRWTICGLLFVATTVNYMDRQILGLLKADLQHDIGWNELEYGRIVIAFQAAYAIGLPIFGWVIDRFGTKLSYAGAMVFWSLAAMAHAMASSVMGFAAARFALGLGEAGNFPAANKATAEWFPKRERALTISFFNAGTNVGAMCAPLLVPWMAAMWGWKGAFIAVGAVGFLWLLAWFPLYHKPAESRFVGDAEKKWINQDDGIEEQKTAPVKWGELLKHRQTWAFCIGKFCTDPIWWFYLFWLPGYLMTQYKIDLKTAGMPLFTVYAMATVGAIIIAQLSSRMISKGFTANRARKTAMLVCGLLVIPIVFATQAKDLWTAVILVGLAAAAHQGFSANIFATVSDMFPKRAVASVTGLGGMAGSIGSILFAELTGRVLNANPDAYWVMFAFGASAYLVALGLLHLMSPRMEPVKLD